MTVIITNAVICFAFVATSQGGSLKVMGVGCLCLYKLWDA